MNINKDSIVTLLGLEKVAPEKQQELVNKIAGLVQDRVAMRITKALTPAQRQELDRVMTGKDSTAVDAYLETVMPDLPRMMNEEVLRMKTELTIDVADLKAQL